MIHESNLINFFDKDTLRQGKSYYLEGRVHHIEIAPDYPWVSAAVEGKRRRRYYQVTVALDRCEEMQSLELEGDCSCYEGYNCKHVVAVLYNLMNDVHLKNQLAKTLAPAELIDGKHILEHFSSHSTQRSPDWGQLLAQFQPKSTATNAVKARLFYQLRGEKAKPVIQLKLARQLKKGGYGKPRGFSLTSYTHQEAKLPGDDALIARLEALNHLHDSYYSFNNDHYSLDKEGTAELFAVILKTGRCYYTTPNHPLKLGESQQVNYGWQINQEGVQTFELTISQETTLQHLIFAEEAIWYLDTTNQICGPIQTDLPLPLLVKLMSLPPITPDEAPKVHNTLKAMVAKAYHNTILPNPLTVIEERTMAPQPKLTLTTREEEQGMFTQHGMLAVYENVPKQSVAQVSFQYGEVMVSVGDSRTVLYEFDGDNLICYPRDLTAEAKALDELIAQGLVPNIDSGSNQGCDFILGDSDDMKRHEQFFTEDYQQLKSNHWDLTVESDMPIQFVLEIDDWYSELDENSEHDWFSFELGIKVEGEKVNLLPVLVDMIHQSDETFDAKSLAEMPDETNFPVCLPDGRYLSIPARRIKGILSVLIELYDTESLDENNQLRLSMLRATHLIELEKAMGAVALRWLGGERLLQLGRKLRDFRQLEKAKIPPGFVGTLRPYQLEGLSWLNFLSQYQLSGLLADDMGLGKTVQTLAHLQHEKTQGRLQKPCLLIAPTSLMANWRIEANRFTPELKVIVIQGMHRHQHFDQLNAYDLILTTYPLILRDKDVWLAHDYHVIILDEAQVMKNPKTKTSLIVHQLKTNYRLCLTGTPMENHLGELWALFHFLLPGLLGDATHFRQLFRVPIEKDNDSFRQQSLNHRIRPFLLRRTKADVAQDLPPKTEMVHTIVLEEDQQDLYESIRMAMEKKVRAQVQEKGLARSHIMILDALLKLRQVCCDPRLLKLSAAKKVKHSAKLDFLMMLLPQLIQEGRRILIFSSFTTMLTLIEDELKKCNIGYVKLTGQTQDRATPIEAFQSGKVPVFLMSLKAGGTGLNLTTADCVIHYDPWWNPAVERQATDRAHRIGQQNPVFVYKLVTEKTVEEKILLMQEKKQAISDAVLDASKRQSGHLSLTAQDIAVLFQPMEMMLEA